MRQIEAAHMAEFDPLQVAPEPFARIQLGGIGRQALHVEPLGRAIGQELLDPTFRTARRTFMNKTPRSVCQGAGADAGALW